MARPPYERGLHALGGGSWAFLQPDGSWGWSNAGLVTDAGEALLVDTLYDLRLTAEMLGAMRRATAAAARIGTLVNTHANGDHCYGNQLVAGARIIASSASAAEMDELPPDRMAVLMKNAAAFGPGGAFLARCLGGFDFEGIVHTPPTETFCGEREIRVGAKEVRLIEVGPAHTRGDVLVHVPADRVVFTGDILFIDGTPIMWAGPVSNWIAACERIAAMDVDAVVPGHGPVTDAAGALRVRDYLVYVRDEARKRHDAGLSAAEAARDIALGDFSAWGDAERIVVNVHTLYREWDAKESPVNVIELFALMAELARRAS
ncbi:MAG: MBL fold metallo-hydrolase [Deltaproteobacteria bacterium]|nr:MBL fold metallo-hydrolase [Deltaproteobacteria bacterium]